MEIQRQRYFTKSSGDAPRSGRLMAPAPTSTSTVPSFGNRTFTVTHPKRSDLSVKIWTPVCLEPQSHLEDGSFFSQPQSTGLSCPDSHALVDCLRVVRTAHSFRRRDGSIGGTLIVKAQNPHRCRRGIPPVSRSNVRPRGRGSSPAALQVQALQPAGALPLERTLPFVHESKQESDCAGS